MYAGGGGGWRGSCPGGGGVVVPVQGGGVGPCPGVGVGMGVGWVVFPVWGVAVPVQWGWLTSDHHHIPLPLWPCDLSHDAFDVTPTPPPWTEWVTHACENITFACFTTRAVINRKRAIRQNHENSWYQVNLKFEHMHKCETWYFNYFLISS